MNFYMYHGRLSEAGGPTTTEGKEIDDWGFEGPTLEGCVGFHSTYGLEGHVNVFFVDKHKADMAQRVTGWDRWEENALTTEYTSRGDLLRIYNRARGRVEYFGDWGIK